MNLMNSGMWGIGFALVDMRQRKLLKRFVATPMRRGDFLLALVTSRLVLMVIEVALLLVFGVLFFHMRVLGSCCRSCWSARWAPFTFGGVGLLTASRAQKIESVSGLINLVMMPMWIFSGVFFSYERFPKMFLPFIKRAAPDRAERRAARHHPAGRQPELAWTQLAILVLWGGVSFCARAQVVPLELSRLSIPASPPWPPGAYVPLLSVGEVRHVGSDRQLVTNLSLTARRSSDCARANPLHPVGHVVLAFGRSGHGGAIGTIALLRVVADSALVFARDHVGCAADVFNRAV